MCVDGRAGLREPPKGVARLIQTRDEFDGATYGVGEGIHRQSGHLEGDDCRFDNSKRLVNGFESCTPYAKGSRSKSGLKETQALVVIVREVEERKKKRGRREEGQRREIK